MPDHKLSSALLYYIILYIVLSIMLADVAALRTGRRILSRSLAGRITYAHIQRLCPEVCRGRA